MVKYDSSITLLWLVGLGAVVKTTYSFVIPTTTTTSRLVVPFPAAATTTKLSSSEEAPPIEDDSEIQWDLFKKHHAKGEGNNASWKGIWTSYDYIGDVVDETIASVNYASKDGGIEQTHTVVVGAKKSDCATCFDTMETKTFPVATYTPQQMHKSRLGSISLVNGPSLLRSGSMATELVLSHGDGRVRVVFQHAPVWEQGVEPGSCPPQALKLFRTMVSRETLKDSPPTFESEEQNPPKPGDPIFFRGVSPFKWHKVWGGTSWTWGPNTGNRGWAIEEMDEMDSWHGRPTGDTMNVWTLRLPGGILIQGPRVVQDGEAGLCRLAWLPDDDTLLRVEASVLALEPMINMEDDTLMGFFPPALGSLRCDSLKKLRDLEEISASVQTEQDTMGPLDEKEAAAQNPSDDDGDNSGLDAVRDALSM